MERDSGSPDPTDQLAPQSGGVWRRYGWSLAVIVTASAFFLGAFFITGFVLDQGDEDGPAPALAAGEMPAPPAAAQPGSTTPDAAVGSAEADAVAEPAPTIAPGEDFTTTELPPFDPNTLIYGGEGADGSILAGPGIVPSSGFDKRTDWELIIPSAQLRAAIVRVGVTAANFLGAPDNPQVIGWWEDGPAPGEAGNVLLDGHRDFSDLDDNVGEGVCWLLTETRPGDPVIIRDRVDGRAYVYTVREIHSVPWDDPDGARFLRSSDAAMLTIVTCEGAFDAEAHNYSQRRVVIADLTDRVAPTSFSSTD